MATLGFAANYNDPFSGAALDLGGQGGQDERDKAISDLRASLESGPGPASAPEAVRQDLNASATDTRKRGQGDAFLSPADIQTQGLNQGNWPGAQNYAGQVNRSTADLFANLAQDQAAIVPAMANGDQPMTALDVQRSGLHQDDFGAAQRYADSINRQKGQLFASLTPEQVRVKDMPPASTPSLPDMAGTPAGGPQALATGEGWYIDSRGQFHSDNEGANIRANRLNAGEGYSVGRGTILDMGPPRSPIGAPNALSPDLGPGLATAGSLVDAGRRLPGNLGMQTQAGPILADMTGTPALTAGAAQGGFGAGLGAAAGPPGYANYNPRLDTTVAQTYGAGGGPNAPGGPQGAGGLPQGFQRQGNSRIVVGPDGTQYITDASGYLNPNADQARAWQSRQNIDVNAVTGFAPDAIEKIRYLDTVGLTTPEEKRFLQTIGTGDAFASTQSYADWVQRHNPEAQRLGFTGPQMAAPARILPMEQAFPIYKEYGDLLKQLGATNITIRPDNHTLYGIGSDTPIMQWRSANNNPMALSGDTPIANVLDDLAKLRTIAANQQQQAAAAAAGGGGGGGGGYGGRGYGSPYGGGGGGGGAAAAAAAGAAPWYSGTPGGRLWANTPEMLANYANSPSYDAINIAQAAGGGIQTSYPNAVPGGPIPWGAAGFDPTGGISGSPMAPAGGPGGAPGMPYFDPTGGVTGGYSPYTTINQSAAANTGYLGDPRLIAPGRPVTGYGTNPWLPAEGTPAANLGGAIGNALGNVVPSTYQDPNTIPGRTAYDALTGGVDNVIANSYPRPGSPEATAANVVGNTADWVRRHLPFGG